MRARLVKRESVLAALWLALAAGSAEAAPLGAAASRGEITRWIERQRTGGARVEAPLALHYAFAAGATGPLEALARELVSAGYAIEALAADAADARLSVTRVELLSSALLGQRSRELEALARKHGAQYLGVDVAASR